MMYDRWDHGGWGSGAWIAMVLVMLACLVFTAVMVVYVVRNLGHRPQSTLESNNSSGDQAMRVLEDRFARGEIDAEEFRQRRDLLRED